MGEIFMSYARQDSAFASKLATDLEAAGHHVWQDLDDLHGGQDWLTAIDQALKQCDRMVLVLSPAALASNWVQNEVAQAISLRKAIIPVLIQTTAELPFYLTRIQQIDFRRHQPQALTQLLDALDTPLPVRPAIAAPVQSFAHRRLVIVLLSLVVILLVLFLVPAGQMAAWLRGSGGGAPTAVRTTVALAPSATSVATLAPTVNSRSTPDANAPRATQATTIAPIGQATQNAPQAPTPTPAPTNPALPATATAQPASPTATQRPPTPAPVVAISKPAATATSFRYHTVSLQFIANKSMTEGYQSPPLGKIELAGVPFHLPSGLNSATTQAEGLAELPTVLTLPDLNIPKTAKVFLLITGGGTRKTFAGKKIGAVTLYFTNHQTLSIDLIPGQNIREWKACCNPNVIDISDPNVQQVWSGHNNFDSGTATIDMLTVQVPENYQRETLNTIEISDRSVQTVGSQNPAINLLGITILSQP